ncbi:Hypothetical predicted protein [Mytilus galloprovincialis]|uniref:Mutator-like transposase domain-containing protein n=1 Tax=Mytilus galloprovincialis TaxID=29158 RepID=A0A8B6GJI2_MYTGA|nr:Hypothetical predicted protein [Mytilus galloprovincialis]
MGNDIVSYRITIGLFYHKTSLGCLRKTVYRYCFSLNDMLAELIKMISRFKLSIRNLYRTCSNLIAFYLVLLCLLLICGDIEPNPGPERTHEYSEKTLSIFHCNIRSLRNKLNYIADIIEDYDVVFFTETHLDSNITDYDISIMGFETPVRKDRNSHGGGIIMYFKNYVHIIRRQDLEHDEIESMWFELKTKLRSILININYRLGERLFGLGGLLMVDCELCHTDTDVQFGMRGPSGSYDINTKASIGMIHVEMGPTHLQNFLAECNLPSITESTLRKKEKELSG